MADLGAEAEMRLRRTGDDKEKTRQDIDCPLRREKAGTSLGKTNPHEFARLRVDKIQVTELLGKCDNNLRGRHHRHPFSPRPQSARALVRPAPGVRTLYGCNLWTLRQVSQQCPWIAKSAPAIALRLFQLSRNADHRHNKLHVNKALQQELTQGQYGVYPLLIDFIV
ncbi:MAG: hypothetical protein RLP08_14490 [Marinovum algicola]|jgi:hypothetical protein|uniref:hypothetical protein n=1 Tax=Marinovum algicola TaxID=42444 RepID=UPI00148155AA|nr:hypothetical protein [Marinovum algicola]